MPNKYLANTRITILSLGQVIEIGDEFPADLPDVDYENLLKEKVIVYGKSLRRSNKKRDSEGLQREALEGDVEQRDGINS